MKIEVNMKPIIALCGPQQHGKSTSAAYLESQGFARVSFAEPLYQMLSTLIGSNARLLDKEAPQDALLGKSVRYALQKLGTEWGREMIGDNIWVETARRTIANKLQYDSVKGIVVDDFRFRNEFSMLKSIGANVACIVRNLDSLNINPNDHASEKEWKELVACNQIGIIDNVGSVEELHDKLNSLF
jgi:hypothetical protein